MTSGAGASRAAVGLNAVIVSVDGTTPRLLTLRDGEQESLPSGDLDDRSDRTLEAAVRRLVAAEVGVPVRYFEQLYTFGDRDRVPGGRALAVAYLALARHQPVYGPKNPRWVDYYELFPWEDWRPGKPSMIGRLINPALEAWLVGSPSSTRPTRTERAELTFGTGQALWDPVRVLDRYELLYELGLVDEAWRAGGRDKRGPVVGMPLAHDHRRIAAAALERLRGKLTYRPVVFEVLPDTFTLSALQQVVEALSGQVLHKQNFRRLVSASNLVEPTGELQAHTGGRPAELYRFRREVLRERPAPGLGLRRLGGP
ncbi:MAG TPA: hypothetical protein VFN61_17030 [Acidimicrobiales bacterium]|nr:hypothetical protein [Acidimicrobiales bacterium]